MPDGFHPDAGAFQGEVHDIRSRVATRLERLLPEDPFGRDLVRLAMREAALAPGRRLRPLMVVLAARDLGVDTPAALDAGCALELLHAAARLIDGQPFMDDEGRGRAGDRIDVDAPESVAVLAAMGLVAQGFGLVAASPLLEARRRLDLVTVLVDTAGVHGIVGGRTAGLGEGGMRTSDILIRRERRSGSLFVAAFEAASIVAGADGEVRKTLRAFAKEIGRAFEILDELVEEELADDLGAGPVRGPTLVGSIGTEAAQRRLAGHVNAAVSLLSALPNGPGRLAALVRMIFTDAVETRRRRRAAVGLPVTTGAPASFAREAPPHYA
jgi:geranylgeranyl diphosphate synthase type II